MQPFMKALTGALTAGVLAVGALVLGPGVADAGPSGRLSAGPSVAPVAPIDWKPCPEHPTAECGTLRLPVDWAHPAGEKFDMAVARRKATDPDRRVGALLVNPGGPGDSGVNFALTRAPAQFSKDLQARFDIVGFDPRGVGGSRPVKCSTELLGRAPSAYPRDQAEFDRLAAYNRELREDCRRHSGPVFDHADTLGVVRDMEALRRSLGEQKLTYFGHSYGTLIGEQYAELYGDRIRAMALTANIDHSLGARDFIVSSAVAAEDSFHEFVKWCGRSPSCALHGRDVTAVWDGLLARADRGEIRDPEDPGRTLSANDIALFAFRYKFYGPDWDELADYVAGLEAQTRPGSHAEPRPGTWETPAAKGTGQQTEAAPFSAVFCQDWRIRPKDYREFARLTEAELRAAPHMRGSPRVHAALAGCVGWPDEVNNPQHRLRITEAPKILMLHSRHDPANNHAWATNVHRQTRGTTVLVTYEGAGHSVYGRSDCTRGAVDGYLMALTIPQDGSSCPAAGPGG
ncbi:alpha/beta fold hydrolase [Streptomyces viridochromogenes]|uniref:alpha/beta fold hydrolase n=1 Tax=Streptomyces viridochromogenes TaxID=1938 RepID=UPI000B052E82